MEYHTKFFISMYVFFILQFCYVRDVNLFVSFFYCLCQYDGDAEFYKLFILVVVVLFYSLSVI